MRSQRRTSLLAIAAFLAGVGSLASGFLALVTQFDFFLIGVVAGLLLGVICCVVALRHIRRSDGTLTGKALAEWGVELPVGGLCLGFLLLPAT